MADTAAGIAEANPRDSEMAADGDEASGELDVTLPGVSRTEYYIENTRGERLFCQEWHNEERHRGALLFIQHGYGDHSSGELALIAERASRDLGFRVYAMDAAGFGRSSGTRGLVTSWQHLLDDLHMFVDRVRGSGGPEPMCPAFILGESMGGAMALASSLERPQLWAGMVLLAPMVKISDDAKPPKWQVPLLKAMAFVAPKWAVVPERYDVFDVCYRDLTVRERARADTLRYTGKTRLGTGAALLEASENLEARLADVRTPFVVLHGDADSLTSPAYSQLLYERASASDKAFLTYENAFHCLHSEPDGVGERVLRDIFAWLEQRTSAAALELLYPPVSVADVTPELPADIAGASAAVAAP